MNRYDFILGRVDRKDFSVSERSEQNLNAPLENTSINSDSTSELKDVEKMSYEQQLAYFIRLKRWKDTGSNLFVESDYDYLRENLRIPSGGMRVNLRDLMFY